MADDPIEITSVTPYGASERPPARLLSSHRARAVGFGWPVVAVLAVLAGFARVYSLTVSITDTTTDNDVDTGIASVISYAVDGWGRPRITHSADGGFGSNGVAGPRYGVLFGIAAGLVLVGWLLTLRAPRQDRQPAGRTLSGLGCVFLLGVVACEIVATLPYRRSFPEIHQTFHFGPSPWLAGGACVLGAVTWAAQFRAQRTVVAADGDVAVPPPAEPSPEPGQPHDQNG